MAKRNSTELTVPPAQSSEPSVESIISMMEYHVEAFSRQMNEVEAVATGGGAWAGSKKDDGSEIDITSRIMFDVIRGTLEDASNYYALKDAIAELRARLGPEAAKAMAQ